MASLKDVRRDIRARLSRLAKQHGLLPTDSQPMHFCPMCSFGARSDQLYREHYKAVRDNIYAIGLTINALRGIERWGASDMMERAFRGFTALPPAGWRSVLGVGTGATLEEAERAFRAKCHEGHSDKGGDADMAALVEARNDARKELA